MDNNQNLGKNNIKVMGEYFVCAELARRNIIATLTLGNTELFDILATTKKGKSILIQVKATVKDYKKWNIGKKREDFVKDNFYYVFVYVGKKREYPEFYIVPSKVASQIVKKTAQEYFSKKGKYGKERRDVGLRYLSAEEVKDYKDKWEQIKD